MNKELQFQMAKLYPASLSKKSINRFKKMDAEKPPPKKVLKQSGTSSAFGRFIIIVVIAVLAALIFSGWMYTVTDKMFSAVGLHLFSSDGQPGIIIIIIHTVLFAILAWLILHFYC